MYRKMLILVIFLTFIIFPFSVNANANYVNTHNNLDKKYEVLIEDDANLLNENEELKLSENMKPLTKYGNIIFKTITYNPKTTTESYARDYYHEKFSTESGTLFLIDMDKRFVYIFSDGDNYKTITSYKAEIITDNIYKYATAEEYYKCAEKAYSQIRSLLEGKKIAEPMRLICNTIFSISLSFMVVYLFVMKVSKIKIPDYKQVMKKAKSKIKIGIITANQIGTHKVYNPPSSSSGGGSSGGGGGSSGGGGGHSF